MVDWRSCIVNAVASEIVTSVFLDYAFPFHLTCIAQDQGRLLTLDTVRVISHAIALFHALWKGTLWPFHNHIRKEAMNGILRTKSSVYVTRLSQSTYAERESLSASVGFGIMHCSTTSAGNGLATGLVFVLANFKRFREYMLDRVFSTFASMIHLERAREAVPTRSAAPHTRRSFVPYSPWQIPSCRSCSQCQ